MTLIGDSQDWEKVSTNWIVNNIGTTYRWIRYYLKENNCIINEDIVDEIFNDVIQYFIDADDYNSDRGTKLKSYIFSGINICVKRYLTSMSKEFNRSYNGDIEELHLQSPMHLDDYTDSTEEIKSLCKALEFKRYKYGIDLFLVCYLGLKIKPSMVRFYLEEIGIPLKSIKKAKKAMRDESFINFVTSISRSDKGVQILRHFVYGADLIDKFIYQTMDI